MQLQRHLRLIEVLHYQSFFVFFFFLRNNGSLLVVCYFIGNKPFNSLFFFSPFISDYSLIRFCFVFSYLGDPFKRQFFCFSATSSHLF